MTIVRMTEVRSDMITYDKLRTLNSGAKNVRIMYGLSGPLRIQLENVRVPFGLSTYPKDEDPMRKYSLGLQLGGTEELDGFGTFLGEMDAKNLSYCAENSKAWWGKAMSREVMQEADTYRPNLTFDQKGGNFPKMKVKLPTYNGIPTFRVFGADKCEIPLVTKAHDGISGGTQDIVNWGWARSSMVVRLIVECEGLWIVNKNVYCTWKVLQLMVLDKGVNMHEYAFIDSP